MSDSKPPREPRCIFCGVLMDNGDIDAAEWCVSCDPAEEVGKLRRRVADLEAMHAVLAGSPAPPQASNAASFTWNVPPNAPGKENDDG